MKLPLSWIKEFIDVQRSPHQIGEILTNAGLEVDSVVSLPLSFEKVIVGEVTATEPHPNADALCVATVSDGKESFQVVCGAPNCRPGIKTAFAMVGATLTGKDDKTFKIKKTKLRDVESFGMLCSEKELGLGEDSQGIMEFADHLAVGADIATLYGDIILEISLTPNLGHCASVLGVARELHAATGVALKTPEIKVIEDSTPVDKKASVTVLDQEKCPRYACRVIKDVKVAPSPLWLQKKLLACDFRPVNNIVDITNYVLLEFGHPLHAFDYDQIDGGKIIVRCAEEGEKFITLDDKERLLCADDLLICDENKPVAIAGVMGGLNSEVGDTTKNILLESAFFEATGIRRTSKHLGLQTEASRRFERACDPSNVIKALDRAAMLIHEIASGNVCKGVIDEEREEPHTRKITCRLSRINAVLGTQLSVSEVEGIFHRLEMNYQWDGKDLFIVNPPTYRVDVREEVDLVEEVARIYGYDNIPKQPARFTSSPLPHAPLYLFEKEIRQRLVSAGLQEFITCDLIGPSLLHIIGESVMPEDAVINVLNPTSIEQSVLRTSLMPALLQVAKYNYDHQIHHVSGFEIGRIHFKEKEQYIEQSVAGILMTGNAHPHYWDSNNKECDFFDLKGIIEGLLKELGIEVCSFKNNGSSLFHPGRQAAIFCNSLEIGSLGEVHPTIIRRLDIPQKVYFAELDLHDLFKVRKPDPRYREVPIFPGSTRDLTITLNEEVAIQEIFNAIYSISSRLLENVTLIGLYRGEKLGAGKKNVTFHFVYRDKKKTIAQEAVDAEHARITSQIEAQIRR